MYAKFVGTLIIMSFHASVWLHAARALLCSYGAASGHVGPKSFPGAAPRRLRFGHSSTNNRNGGQYGYYQFAGLLPILYIRLLHGEIRQQRQLHAPARHPDQGNSRLCGGMYAADKQRSAFTTNKEKV